MQLNQTTFPLARRVTARRRFSTSRISDVGFRASGFTLMELTVSIGILVIIILAVGVIFSGASKSVSVSNATMEMMSSVRNTQQLIERDVAGIDRSGYIAIRCNVNDPRISNVPGTNPPRKWAEISYRFDQISFITVGSFNNRTGANTAAPFTDSSVAGASIAWWGQGVLEAANPADSSYLSTATLGQDLLPNGNAWQRWAGQLPTGVIDPGVRPANGYVVKENEFMLMRHLSLLFPGPVVGGNTISPTGQPVMAYSTANLSALPIAGLEGKAAHITSSRYANVAMTSSQVMQAIVSDRNAGTVADMPEVDLLTYRYRALASVYDTDVGVNPFVNGYFRTHPSVMQGVSTFKVEWTDGKIYPPGDPQGRDLQLKWYGPTNPSGGNAIPDPSGLNRYGNDNSLADTTVEQWGYNGTALNNITHTIGGSTIDLRDQYIALFTYTNRAKWPKALRITMHVASDRLSGGRDFVQVINVPQ